MDAVVTQGTDLKIGDGATPEVFTSIDGITSLNGFGTTRSEIDVTTLKDSSKKFKLGLKDNGTLQVETNYNPDDPTHQDIRDLNDSGLVSNFELSLTDTAPATKFSFEGYISQWSLRVDVDNVYKAQFSVRISGDITES
jgi:hypothetical protein